MRKKVCVIGAGPSGLVMIKELLDSNIDVKCFESHDTVGGAFRSVDKGGRSYDSVKLTVSNYFMAYSDFMPKEGEARRYWSVSEYRKYLMRYIDNFNLMKRIFFSHEVISSHIENNKVVVKIVHKQNEITEIFDHLIICTGSNFIPKQPELLNEIDFKGQIFHSSEYINAEKFKNKNVLCIGLGESGADIVHEIGQVANHCEVLVRDYPNVIPRWINGHTNDSYTTSLFYSLKKNGIDSFMRWKAWYYLNFDNTLSGEDRLIQKWVSERESFMGKFFTKTDVFVKDILDKRLKLTRGKPIQYSKNGIITESDREIKADVIMFNTGYKTSFKEHDFGKDFENPRELFKHMIHPEYGDKVSLIGWARPSQGGLPACSEMQARYMAGLISGLIEIPTKSKMEASILKDKKYNENLFNDSVNIKSLVCYHKFMTSMAKLIGCKPKPFYMNDLKLTKKLIFGSHISSFYRLKDIEARKTIKSLPIVYTKRRALVLFLFVLLFNPLSFINKF